MLGTISIAISVTSLLLRTPVVGLLRTVKSHSNQHDLILIEYICKDSSSKEGHILKFQVDRHLAQGDTTPPGQKNERLWTTPALVPAQTIPPSAISSARCRAGRRAPLKGERRHCLESRRVTGWSRAEEMKPVPSQQSGSANSILNLCPPHPCHNPNGGRRLLSARQPKGS